VRLIDIDRAGLVFARTRGHDPGLERAVAAYSRAGEHAACWLALGLVGALASLGPDRAARRRLAPAWALYLATGAFAVSRPYLGVHYPSDVVAGAVLGTGVAEALS